MITNTIKNFKAHLESEYPAYCTQMSDAEITLNPMTTVRMEDWDLTKHQNRTECFLLPESINSEDMDMDGTEDITVNLSLYMFIRANMEDLIEVSFRHVDAMKTLIKTNFNADSTVGEINMTSAQVFNRVEDSPGVACVHYSLEIADDY